MRVNSMEDAKKKLQKAELIPKYANQLLTIVEALITSEPDQGVGTDELMGLTGFSSEELRGALYDLEHLGLVANDTAITAYVHIGVSSSSKKKFENTYALETELINLMREAAPDLPKASHLLFIYVALRAAQRQRSRQCINVEVRRT